MVRDKILRGFLKVGIILCTTFFPCGCTEPDYNAMPIENKFDYGITAGLGCEFHTKLGHFMIDGRYYFALSDIYGNSKRDVFARSAHGTILAKFTYLFNLRSDKTPRK